MAVRTGAGTGVIVSLVVTIITSVFLLVTTIMFYAGRTEALEKQAAAEDTLDKYVNAAQRNSDTFKAIEQEASRQRQSVVGYMQGRYESLMDFVDPNSDTMEALETTASNYGVTDSKSMLRTLQDTSNELGRAKREIEGLNERLAENDREQADLRAQIDQLKDAHRDEVEGVQAIVSTYRDAGEQYRRDVEDTIDRYESAISQLRNDYETQVRDLENQIDSLIEQRGVLTARIDDLEARINRDRATPKDPAMLVDGRVIDAAGTREEVFIDRGREHRIVLGMTFEVYDDAGSIRVNPQTGQLPRGKASIEIIKVGETTSTAKITRSVRGRPVVGGDVIANAIYDPDYQYKFLVHGNFDTNNDGRATRKEGEYLESLVLEWGGTVHSGTEIPGDLDFLVLGVEPPMPPELSPRASDIETQEWLRRRQIRETYLKLFDQATEAQIPVLNANRFMILIGHTNR